MGNLYFGTSRLAILAIAETTLLAGCGPIMIGDKAVFVSPPDTAIYCGAVSSFLGGPYSYTLHVSATAGGSPGRFRITFKDRDSMGFEVTASSTNNTAHALGGVAGVDEVVKITAEGGVQNMMANVEVWSVFSIFERPLDPFDETQDGAPAQFENFCLKAPGDPGKTSAAQIIP